MTSHLSVITGTHGIPHEVEARAFFIRAVESWIENCPEDFEDGDDVDQALDQAENNLIRYAHGQHSLTIEVRRGRYGQHFIGREVFVWRRPRPSAQPRLFLLQGGLES